MATPPKPPIVISGAPVQLGALTGGGWDGSQEPIGGTFVVGLNGDVLIGDGYTANFLQITPSGTDTVLAAGVGGSNAALDVYGNVYFGGNYNSNIYKLPFNTSTGQYVGFTTAPTTNCVGGNQDTAPCIFAPAVSAYMGGTLAGSGASGYAGVAFDGQGDFFFETNTLPKTDPNAIFECNLACIASSTATPTLIYADSKSVGAFTIDPWGNLFFVDGNNGSTTNLNEIPLSSGSYAATPTVVLSYTNAASYGNGISGLAINGSGTIFISDNADGSFAIPNTQAGGPSVAGMYMITTMNGKGLALDAKGSIYTVPYNGGDVVDYVPVGFVSLGASPVTTAATGVNATIFDSEASCGTPPMLAASVTEFGASTTEFTAAAGATCSTAFGGTNGVFSAGPLTAAGFASFSLATGFTPTADGERLALLTVTDSTNAASGTTALSGVGQLAQGDVDPGVSTAYGTGFTTPYSVSVDVAGDLAIADEGAGKVFWIPAGSPANTAPTSIGTGFTEPSATTFDANGNLYIADFSNNNVVEIPDVAGVLTPASQSTLIPSTMTFAGTALSKPSGLGVGPKGTLYISDFGNDRVVSYNLITGQTGVAIVGLKNPWGVAVDSSANIYVADTGNGNVLIDAAGEQSTLTIAGVSAPWGIAVDASGSLIVSDHASGNIAWLSNYGGDLSTNTATTIEKNPSSALGIALDKSGNLYTTDATGKTVYAIQRTAASINLGAVQDGVTNSGNITLANEGNASATLTSPIVTQPTNTMFTLAPASGANGCMVGTGAPGGACQITATFAPPVSTPNGPQTGVGTINVATPALSISVNMSGTATISSILPQTITGFNPPAMLLAGQTTTLSATGGASGQPVVFSIDPSSACPTCATVSGSVLTAVSAGSVKVDANQAAGTANGNQYAAAPQVQASITINNATAAGVPGLILTQTRWIAAPGGGFTAGANLAGGSFAITQQGNVVVGTQYGSTVAFINGQTGATTQVSFSNPGGVAIDSKNNIYISHDYNSIIYKLPYVNGAYATLVDAPATAPPACTGTDTAECTFVSFGTGTKAIAFDPSGNFWGVSTPSSTGASTIYECNASCQPAGTGVAVYADANAVSQIAWDPWGNLFFTDGVYTSAANVSGLESASSNLNELKYTSGTGYAATPVALQVYTDPSPGGYDNQLDGVGVLSNGTIYYATQNEGTFAIPNTQTGGPATTHQYAVGNTGAKGLELDSSGNVWVMVYSTKVNSGGGDTLGEMLVGDVTAPTAQLDGPPVTATASITDNVAPCSSAAALLIASSNTEFAGTGGTACSTLTSNFSTAVSGALYPATFTFTATQPNTQTANLSLSDTANGGEGTGTISGFSQATPQTLTFTAPTNTTFTYSPTLTIAVSVTNGGSNLPVAFTVDSSSTGAGTFSATTVTGTTSKATLTVTQAGSITIDANEGGGLISGIYYDPATQAQLPLTIGKETSIITFAEPTSPQVYAPGLTVNLSALGDGASTPVVFSVDGSSTGAGTVSTTTVNGNTSTATLTVTTAGTIVLDANQATDANYAAAAQVQQVLVVNPASQTITFTPVTVPLHYIASCPVINECAVVQVQATGGATDNAVAISPDTKNTVSFTILSSSVSKTGGITTTTIALVPNQTLASPANLVLDGNQQGNANYSAAAQATLTIPVLAPLPTQTITFPLPQTQPGGTTLALTATATSGFAVTYASSTTSVCTVSGSTATFASVASASTCTITASQAGDNLTYAPAIPVTVSFTVNPPGQVPAMNLAVSIPTLTIEPGTVGLTQITVTSQNNFTGNVTFTCSGLPTGYICSFNPNPLNVAEGGSSTTTLTVTPPSTAALVRHDFRPIFPATLAVALCFLGFRKKNRMQLFIVLVVLFAGLGLISGCGGTSTTSTSKPVTSNGTITATSGSMQVTSSFTVTFE